MTQANKTSTKKTVHVAVGIVLQGNKVFLTKRAEDVHQGGKWEFPGGKVEIGETVDQALYRELKEEIGIEVKCSSTFMHIEHDYPKVNVHLDFIRVDDFEGTASGCEGQLFEWFEIGELASVDFPEANKAVVEKLLAL
ncbi:MAG: 8-oxo-dGTP diphosphatase MutT [Psychrosphaera sp.]|nr:8-oxo-dGTP diphosphatase MutT [Psychrosphaera sp.]